MRNPLLIGAFAAAAVFAFAQTASAERVCKEVCDGGSCVQKCVEHDDTTVIERDRVPPRPGVDVEIGR